MVYGPARERIPEPLVRLALKILQILGGQYLLVALMEPEHYLRRRYYYFLDEMPTYARASLQNQFAHLVREINLGDL